MAIITFPSSPTTNQTYTVGSKTWIWNGYAWDLQLSSAVFSTANGTIAWNTANAAFIQANTPNYVANSASIYANGAFTVANSSFIQANAAFTTANSAASTGKAIAMSIVFGG